MKCEHCGEKISPHYCCRCAKSPKTDMQVKTRCPFCNMPIVTSMSTNTRGIEENSITWKKRHDRLRIALEQIATVREASCIAALTMCIDTARNALLVADNHGQR